MDQRPTYKPVKLLDKNIGENLCDAALVKDFSDITPTISKHDP